MDISDSESSVSTSMMDVTDNQSFGERQSSRLQKKIDVVQQVVTILEQTMAQGKALHEKSNSSIQSNMNILMKTIEGLRGKLVQDEAAFSRFSAQIGGEINRYCALDNILRTVEESQTENDVKILLPDVSDLDSIIQRFSAEKVEEWKRLKDESKRLNIESIDEENRMRNLTLKVTLKTNIEDICPDVSANAAAQLLNSFMGKSMSRDTIVKFIKLIWDERSFPSSLDMLSTARRIVHQVYPEGVIMSVEEFSKEEPVSGLRMEKVWLQGSHRVSLKGMSESQLPLIEITERETGNSEMRVFQFGTQERPQNNGLSESMHQPGNPHKVQAEKPAAELDDEIQIVKEIKRTSRVLFGVKKEPSVSPGTRCITAASPVRSLNNQTAPGTSTKDASISLSPRKPSVPFPRSISSGKSSAKTLSLISPESIVVTGSPSPSTVSDAASLLKAPRRTSLSQSSMINSDFSLVPTTSTVVNSSKRSASCSTSPIKKPLPSVTHFTSNTTTKDQGASPFEAEIFSGALLKKSVIKQMQATGVNSLLEFQSKIIEAVLTGRDVFCLGSEGVGKTLSLVLSTLQKIDPRTCSPQVFYITSSASKAQNVFHTIKKYSEHTGISYQVAEPVDPTEGSWESQLAFTTNPHVIIGTLSSLLRILSFNRLLYDGVTTLVLDDLDEMVQKGLHSTVVQLVYNLNASIQTMVSSKHKTEALEKLCNRILRNVVSVSHIVKNSPQACPPPNELSKQMISSACSTASSAVNRSTCVPEEDEGGAEGYSSSVSSVESPCDLRPNSSENSGDESDLEVDSDEDSDICLSPDSDDVAIIEDFGYDTLHMRRNSTEETETIVQSNNVFDADENVMTFIPEYVLRRLGVPVMVDCNSVSQHGNVKAEPRHISVIMDTEDLKIQTISLLDIGDEKTIIFCNSVEKVEFLATELRQRHLWPQTMHEDLPRSTWVPVLRNFSRGKLCKLIIATDFMAEVTLQGASYIINYEFPIPARNYISRCAFASRHVNVGGLPRYPYVISFVTSSNLEDVEDLRKTFGIDIQLQHEVRCS